MDATLQVSWPAGSNDDDFSTYPGYDTLSIEISKCEEDGNGGCDSYIVEEEVQISQSDNDATTSQTNTITLCPAFTYAIRTPFSADDDIAYNYNNLTWSLSVGNQRIARGDSLRNSYCLFYGTEAIPKTCRARMA